MAFKFIPPIKVRFYGDVSAGQDHIKFAKNQLAILERQMSFQNIHQGRRVVSPYDGVLVECLSNFSQHEVRIFVAPPKQIITVAPRSTPEISLRKLPLEVLYQVVSLAYNWTWDATLVPDPALDSPEEHATSVVEPNCYAGYVGAEGLELLTPIGIPKITEHETPYRVTDLSQVRYTGEGGKMSLVMADYCERANNDIRYTAVSVIGEGGYPSMVLDVSLNIDDYDEETEILDTIDCVVEVDASLSLDLQTLYKIVVIRGEGSDAKNAVINYEVYSIDTESNAWVQTKTGQVIAPGTVFGVPQLYIRRHVKVDREGFMGVFSQENPAAIYDYSINTPEHSKYVYRSVCQRYLYSIVSEDFVETTDYAYAAKIVNITTYDYEIVKSDDGVESGETFTNDTTFSLSFWPWLYTMRDVVFSSTRGLGIEFIGFTDGGMFSSNSHSYYSTTAYIPPGEEYWELYDEIPSGGIPIVLPRRTILTCSPLTYLVGQYEKFSSLDPYVAISEKRFMGVRLTYPIIDSVNGVIEAKNAFICCDNSMKAVFYGQHVRSTVETQTTVDREVPLHSDPDPITEKTYSEWHILFQSADLGTFDVTGIVAAKYGEDLLVDLTDPELLPEIPVENWPPWKKDPIEYTMLEPFFGIMFHGSTVTEEVQ